MKAEMYQMKQNQKRKSLNITSETKPRKNPTEMPAGLQTNSQTGTIHPGILYGRTPFSVSPRAATIASHQQFKPTRIGENLVVNYCM